MCSHSLRDLILYNKTWNSTSFLGPVQPQVEAKIRSFLMSQTFFPDSALSGAEWYNNHIIIYPLLSPFISARRNSGEKRHTKNSYALLSATRSANTAHGSVGSWGSVGSQYEPTNINIWTPSPTLTLAKRHPVFTWFVSDQNYMSINSLSVQ